MSQAKTQGTKSDQQEQPVTGTASAAAQAASVGFVPFETLVPLQRAQMEAFAKATQTLMDGLMAINREVMGFAEQRANALRDGAKTPPAEQPLSTLWSQQMDFASNATQAYLQEANKLFELGMKVSQESWAPLQETMTTAFTNGGRKRD